MSTRVDQRGKTPQQQNRPPVNGNVRLEEYDYNGHPTQMHAQPHAQQAQYNATMPMPSPTADNYMNQYYHQSMTYPAAGFFDTGAWSTSGTDALSYLNTYGQHLGAEYMQFSGFDYNNTPATFWSGYTPDYSWTTSSLQPDPTKMLDGQSYIPAPMDQAYAETYHSPTGAQQKHMTNGQDIPAAISEPNEVNELEQGMQKMSVNGHGDGNQSSPSETSLHEPTMANVNNSSVMPAPNSSAQSPVKTSWANVAKKPAKPVTIPPKILTRPQPAKANHENNWDKGASRGGSTSQGQRSNAWSAPRNQRNGSTAANSDRLSNQRQQQTDKDDADSDPTLNKLKLSNAYNPKSFDISAKNARFFVIKSYSEDDIHRAIKYGVWCSTEHGNKRLDSAFKEREGKGPIYLFYSVNGSGHFCGMAQMMSGVDYQTHAGVWTQDKWKGSMEIKWIYVKDVPNGQLRHIRLENNENKPVTNSRDTQEVPADKGKQVLKIIHSYRHSTSIFDDFGHYEKKEVEEGDSTDKKKPSPKLANGSRN